MRQSLFVLFTIWTDPCVHTWLGIYVHYRVCSVMRQRANLSSYLQNACATYLLLLRHCSSLCR
ncbi:hypothetical protein FA15DRAFT_67957 [Coprinopsis marcescibilis]|uniref:Uncharacterized protein n=1 Tax=Coprinopsis marcescibilis TaxID=230819 RepID=A0A5C3KN39_COPMA|nr:hypothetical protein FA15DRAFT_67957 [Coprinopsis marcescibilis]